MQMRRILGKGILLLLLAFFLNTDSVKAATLPKISGMFIRNDMIASKEKAVEQGKKVWDQDQYIQLASDMFNAGMTIMIPQTAVNYESSDKQTFYYPTERYQTTNQSSGDQENQLTYSLEAAKAKHMNVFLPLQLSENDWFTALYDGFKSQKSQNFLKESALFSMGIADEMMQKYGSKYAKEISGWYLPFELDNSNLYDPKTRDTFINLYLKPVTNHLKKLNPTGRIITSPLLYTNLKNPTESDIVEWNTMWKEIFEQTVVDTLMPQDGGGWESATALNLGPWYASMKTSIDEVNQSKESKNIELWNNPECYSMTGSGTMDIRRLLDNMAAVSHM
ncbi:DUF4434 domain-containing protein [Listeria aquatica]|uniref:DUF4434 domain-containing protein n=1 Tax=Listeria aquatica TaxID=1494960 RepID=UPI0031F50B54